METQETKQRSKKRKRLMFEISMTVFAGILAGIITATIFRTFTAVFGAMLGITVLGSIRIINKIYPAKTRAILSRMIKYLSTILKRLTNIMYNAFDWIDRTKLRIKTFLTETYFKSLRFRIFLAGTPVSAVISLEYFGMFILIPMLAKDNPGLIASQTISAVLTCSFLFFTTVMITLPSKEPKRKFGAGLSESLMIIAVACFIGTTLCLMPLKPITDVESEIATMFIGIMIPLMLTLLPIVLAYERINQYLS